VAGVVSLFPIHDTLADALASAADDA